VVAPPQCCIARDGRAAVAVSVGVAGGVPTQSCPRACDFRSERKGQPAAGCAARLLVVRAGSLIGSGQAVLEDRIAGGPIVLDPA
jgi:hypothetical protein